MKIIFKFYNIVPYPFHSLRFQTLKTILFFFVISLVKVAILSSLNKFSANFPQDSRIFSSAIFVKKQNCGYENFHLLSNWKGYDTKTIEHKLKGTVS
jgi:hypothetical protein